MQGRVCRGYDCGGCGQHHDELLFSYWAPAPAYWDEFATDEHSVLVRALHHRR